MCPILEGSPVQPSQAKQPPSFAAFPAHRHFHYTCWKAGKDRARLIPRSHWQLNRSHRSRIVRVINVNRSVPSVPERNVRRYRSGTFWYRSLEQYEHIRSRNRSCACALTTTQHVYIRDRVSTYVEISRIHMLRSDAVVVLNIKLISNKYNAMRCLPCLLRRFLSLRNVCVALLSSSARCWCTGNKANTAILDAIS